MSRLVARREGRRTDYRFRTAVRDEWRYDLAPHADRTDVTLTYDWSGTSRDFRERVGAMPIFPEDYLAASLATLERYVAN